MKKIVKVSRQGNVQFCATCNSINNVGPHHVVPVRYLEYFKERLNHDFNRKILIKLCRSCHNQYELKSTELHKELCLKFLSKEERMYPKIMNMVKNYTKANDDKKDRIVKVGFEMLNVDIRDYLNVCHNSHDKWTLHANAHECKLIVERMGEENLVRTYLNHFLINCEIPYMYPNQKDFLTNLWENHFQNGFLKNEHYNNQERI